MGKDYITEEKRKELESELAELAGPKRKEILEVLSYAKSLGDLKENAEYHQARDEQGKNEDRIKTIEHILRNAEVVKSGSSNNETVGIGSVVVVRKSGDTNDLTYTIVGAEESDMALGKVSNKSPLGGALFDKKVGDTATVTTPKGSINYETIKIS